MRIFSAELLLQLAEDHETCGLYLRVPSSERFPGVSASRVSRGRLLSERHAAESAGKLGAGSWPLGCSQVTALGSMGSVHLQCTPGAGLGVPNWGGLGFPACPWAGGRVLYSVWMRLESRSPPTCVEVTTCVEFVQLFILWCARLGVGSALLGRRHELEAQQVCVLLLEAASQRMLAWLVQGLTQSLISNRRPQSQVSILDSWSGAYHKRPSGAVCAVCPNEHDS